MSNVSFSFELAQELFNSTEDFPISFEDAWQWLEYSRKDNAKANFLKCNFVEGVDFEVLKPQELRPQGGYSNREDIYMTCECLKQWGMMAGTHKGKEVRMYFLKCEKLAKAAIAQQQPALDALSKADKAISIAERYLNVFKTMNPAMEQCLKDLIGNTLMDGQKQIPGSSELWMGVVNFAEVELGYKVSMKGNHCRTNLGKWIAFYCADLADRKDRRYCNETQRDIFVYPFHIKEVRDRMEQQIRIFFKHPKPTEQLKVDGAYKKPA